MALRHLLLGAALVLAASAALAEVLVGRVVAVADGDTLTVLDASRRQRKVRLAGIDAPEKKQPFGNVSRQSLGQLTQGKQVLVEWHKRDRYGRLVGKVYVDNLDVNLEQIRRGLAWHYVEYANEQSLADRTSYSVTEHGARSARRGLWQDSSPIPPWEWRRK